jgi:pimeloyl-[acyl-carrier protein] synthase
MTVKSPASLTSLLDADVLADPYPLFHQLRAEDPVHWDPYLHAWVVTSYADVVTVLYGFSADRTPTPEKLVSMGLADLSPLADVMVKQMLFMDAPSHTRIRKLAAAAFAPARVTLLRDRLAHTVEQLLDDVESRGRIDVIADIADPLPSTINAEMLGVPVQDAPQLKRWSRTFAEMLGNFQHNYDRTPQVRSSVQAMTEYFRAAISETARHRQPGLISSFLEANEDGDTLSVEEMIANLIVTMIGGQETTTNLIGNGTLTLLRHPDEHRRLLQDRSLLPSAIEEMLRFESPIQQTARLAPNDRVLGGKLIRKGQAVIAVIGAANRDPTRFPEPDVFDIGREDNRHLAFGWGAHFCFGAALARIEAEVAFASILDRFPNLHGEFEQVPWMSTNLGYRGLSELLLAF